MSLSLQLSHYGREGRKPPARDFPERLLLSTCSELTSACDGFILTAVAPMRKLMAKVIFIGCIALLCGGCATKQRRPRPVSSWPASVSTQNPLHAAEPVKGSLYEVGIYVIAPGDTYAGIARTFGCALPELKKLNGGLSPIQVGQHLRVYERELVRHLNREP